MTNSSLWTNLRSGDITALEDLYKEYADGLYQYGMILIQDPDKVKDHIHDLFILIWNSRERITTPESTKAYLFTSLRRRLFDKGTKINSLIDHMESLEAIPVMTGGYDDLLIANEEEQALQVKMKNALERLSERQREIIYMKYYQELEYEEISRIMNLNYQSARNLLLRALTALRKEMLAIVIILLMLA